MPLKNIQVKFDNILTKTNNLQEEKYDLQTKLTAQEVEITQKNNRLTQLEKLFQGTAKIFNKQHNYVDQLKQQLEKEKQDKNISQEQATHLEEDITRLEQEKTQLAEKIKELENLNEENKRIRDTEIQDLREKLTNLAQIIEQIQRVDEQVYAILGQVSQATGLLPRTQQVVAILNKPKREFGTQTNITIPKTEQWETLEKYKQDIQKEQNKVSALQNKLANLRQEIKNLQDQTKLNPAEQELSKYVKQQTWKNVNFQTLKITLTNLERDFSHKLRPNYQDIRTKLLELVNSLIEGKETQEQLENRNKDLEEKLKEGDLNEQERKLMSFLKGGEDLGMDAPMFFGDEFWQEELKKVQNDNEWTQLRDNYEEIRQKLISLAKSEIEKFNNQQTITDLAQKKNELQTQLDLATKTKEELAEELALEKGWWDKWMNDNDNKHWGGVSANYSNAKKINFTFLAKTSIPSQPSSDFPGFEKVEVSFVYDRSSSSSYYYYYYKKAIKDLIYEYYKDPIAFEQKQAERERETIRRPQDEKRNRRITTYWDDD